MLVLNPDTFKSIIRPLIFGLPPEAAQGFAETALKQQLIWKTLSPAFRVENGRLEVNLGGIWVDNPVGLAAGYDKNCETLPSLSALGFGYVTGGTVTESPRPGNPSPRIVRYAEEESLVNSMGFPSKGLDYAAGQLERAKDSGDPPRRTPVVVSVSGVTVDEIVHCHRRLEPLADAIEINISSPNTAGLRVFQEPDSLAGLLDAINAARMKPLFVKMPPYVSPELTPSVGSEVRDRVIQLARVCVDKGVSALTVANTWPVRESRLAVGSGGLSGRVIFPDMLNMVREIRAEVGNRVAINACGGVSSGEDAWDAIRAGATTVQLYTALVYQGPGVVKRINKELLELMDRNEVGSVSLGLQRG